MTTTTNNKDLATRTVNDDSEDGEGSVFIGSIKVNGPRDFEIPAKVQTAIDQAKGA